MHIFLLGASVCAAFAGLIVADDIQTSNAAAAARTLTQPNGQCRRSTGRGVAPTERLARLQAWERVAQATGNWPVQTDTFDQERYRCGKQASGWRCQASIVVCRKS